jgi:hypothetical protein
MIEIDLLPAGSRRKKRRVDIEAIPVIPIAVSLVALVVAAHLILISANYFRGGTLKRVETTWQELQPQKDATDRIVKETQDLQKRVDAVKKIASPELSWTRLLSGLNQAMMPGIWLSGMSVEYGGRPYNPTGPSSHPTKLVLTGYAVGRSEVATTGVARFINSLKRSGEFSAYFKDIELANMSSQLVDGQETMLFSLSCDFAEKNSSSDSASKSPSGRRATRR